ncbi:MAG: MFS transporter [Rubrobacteraceae bacterium]
MRAVPGTGNRASPGSRLVLLTLLAASSLTVMSGATVAPSLPGLQESFSQVENSEILVRLVLTVPALFIAIFAPLAGSLVDRVGRKQVLLYSVILYGIAGGSGLILDNLYAILAGRALLGVAVAGVMTSATALIADYYSGRERSHVLGLQAAFMGFGGVLFLALGGFLAGVDWRGPFAIYVAALVLVPLVALRLWEPSRQSAGGSEDGKTRGSVPDAGSTVRLLALLYAMALVGMVIFYVVPTQLPFYFEGLLGIGATGAGLAIALMTLCQSLASLSYERIRARFGYNTIGVLTFALIGVGYVLIGLADTLPLALLGLAVGGAGVGLLLPNLNNWISSGIPDNIRGRALGGLTAAIFLGQFLSPLFSQPVGGTLGFGVAFLVAGAVSAAMAASLVAVGRKLKLPAIER